MSTTPYNPLDKVNLARSIEAELLSRDIDPLASVDHIVGAGVYAIYYSGGFAPYASIASANAGGEFTKPIYVGKAIPKGGRKGGLTLNAGIGKALSDRLKQHATSVDQASNLNLADFAVRHLVVEDIWIPLGENVLIESFKPLWNRAIDGFGNKDPGKRRKAQFKSPWDVLHPGRQFAVPLADGGMTQDFLVQRVTDYVAGRPLAKLPKAVAEEQDAERLEAEESADEV